MTVYPSSIPIARHSDPFTDAGDDRDPILPPWLVATVLIAFSALAFLSSIEPFHYEGVERHLVVTAAFAAYVVLWKEIFRRYVI